MIPTVKELRANTIPQEYTSPRKIPVSEYDPAATTTPSYTPTTITEESRLPAGTQGQERVGGKGTIKERRIDKTSIKERRMTGAPIKERKVNTAIQTKPKTKTTPMQHRPQARQWRSMTRQFNKRAVKQARQRAQKQAAKQAAKTTVKAAKATGKAVVRIGKAIGAAVAKGVSAIIAAGGGGVLIVVLLFVVVIGAIAASPFGLFFASEPSDTGDGTASVSVAEAVAQVNMDFNAQLEALQAGDYANVTIEGAPPDWADILGNIFCGHCKNRLTLTTSGRKRKRADGSISYESRARYQCHYNVRHPGECDGQSGYGMTKLDGIMDKVIRYQFAKIRAASENDIISEQHEKAVELARARYKLACMQLTEKERELRDYEDETIKVIRGQSRLSTDLLNDLIDRCKAEIALLTATVEAAKQELDECMESAAVEQAEYAKLRNWADLYENCTFAAKKMIVSQFVKSVYVYRDYMIEVEFNVTFDEFKCLEAECENGTNENAVVHLGA